MSYEIINAGILPNDGLGDPVRVAVEKINNNFINLNSIVGANLTTIVRTDSIRTVFSKVNDNFSTIFTSVATNLATIESSNINQSNYNNVTNIDQMVVNYPALNQEVINTGLLPNDGTGDSLRTAFVKINNNFSSIFGIIGPTPTPTLTPAVIQTEPVIIEAVIEPIQPQNIVNIGQFIINSTQIVNQTTSPFNVSYSSATPTGEQEWINIGEQPNDGTGDPLRTAFSKINNNFSNLFSTTTVTGNTFTTGLTPNQVIYQIPSDEFSHGKFQIRSSDPNTIDMQDVTLTASITNNEENVKFSAYGTLFEGNVLCSYDMDVFEGNVRLLVNPIKNATILHFITSEVTVIGNYSLGYDIALDGYPEGSLMGTQDDIILITETV
jgi:hypothetical protein